MRKFLIPIIAAGSALAVAAPAAAQWAPPVYNYQPYDYGRAFSGRGFGRAMEVRVQRLRNDIRELRQRGILSGPEYYELSNQAGRLQRRIFYASRNGIQPGEAQRLERQIRQLEFRIQREARDWNGRANYRRHRY